MRKTTIKFESIPEWTYEGKKPNIYTFFESIALAGLEDKWIRISADDQRKILGYPVFGKREIRVNDGYVESIIKVCFGTDFERAKYSAKKIEMAVDSEKQLCPGYTGEKYM